MSRMSNTSDNAPIACPEVPTVLANCTADMALGTCVAYPPSDNRTGRASWVGAAGRCFNVRAFYGGYCTDCGVQRVATLPMSQLQTIALTNNSISSFRFPNEGAVVPTVTKVLLGQNLFTSLADIQLPNSVVELNVSSNRIVDLVFTNGLNQVKILNVSNNPIRTVDGGGFKGSVASIFATNLNLSSLASLAFPYTTQLLDLSLNGGASWTNFRPPVGLVTLNASNSSIEQLSRIDFAVASALTTLIFANNQISTIEGVRFPPSLKTFDLGGSKVTKFTIRQSDVDVLGSVEQFSVASVSVDPAQCEKPGKMTGVTIQNKKYDVCVLSDADFDSAYGDYSGAVTTSDMVLPVIIVSVCVVVLVALAAATLVIKRRKLRKLEATRTTRNTHGTGSSESAAATLDDFRDDPALTRLRVDQKQVARVRTLAKGGFGVVHLAMFDKREVVMKQLLPEKAKDPRAISAFVAEIRLCARLDHPRIVSFLGLTWSTLADLAILFEYMPNGDLAHLLKKHREAKAPAFGWRAGGSVGRSKLELAQDVAEALVYLHGASIVHRDLKAQNVLLSSAWEAKLTDFGVSRAIGDQMTAEVGTVAWIAPEVLKGEGYGVAADVYSFGVLLSELDTCDKPYAGGVPDSAGGALAEPSNARVALAVIEGKLAPAFRADCPAPVLVLARRCLSYAGADRPTAAQLLQELQALARAELSEAPSELSSATVQEYSAL